MFYIYPKSEKELALMHRKTPVGINPEKWSSYKEIMSIPIVSSYKIQIDDPIITHYKYGWFDEYAAIVYDGILIGGLYNRREKLLSVSDYDFDLYYLLGGNRGFRLFDNGQYVGTTSFGFEDEWLNGDRIHVDLQHNGAPFNGLGINLPDPDVRVCEKTYLDTSAKLYQNYIAQILSDSGLENAPVNITEVIGSDVTEKGSEDILIIADNSTSKKLTSTNYSLGVMFTKTENGVEFTRLFMDANTCSSAEANNDSDYEYEICEIVDFDCNGVCEIVVKRKSDKENAYQIYEFVDYGKEKAFILRTERIVQA
ncbi:MAG: hypothetical protein LBS21_14210 [Clostridiales bacterium]|nr:hypothetical protein [Clostridiales bacterium]